MIEGRESKMTSSKLETNRHLYGTASPNTPPPPPPLFFSFFKPTVVSIVLVYRTASTRMSQSASKVDRSGQDRTRRNTKQALTVCDGSPCWTCVGTIKACLVVAESLELSELCVS